MSIGETDQLKIYEFQDLVWNFYKTSGRHDLPWRQPSNNREIDPFHVLVSELMLQQTQVNRVIPKFQEFLKHFPEVHILAQAELASVLTVWSGLGYNRRAKFLHQAASKIVSDFNGEIPHTQSDLVTLPGVGLNTAAAIITYSFNEPVPFIETNIRTVYIHHFFKDRDVVTDSQLMPLIEASLDSSDPRGWYWAIMDYGSHLKSVVGNASQKSKHYTIQSRFEGSNRQVRGEVLKRLTKKPLKKNELESVIDDKRLWSVLNDLIHEELISCTNGTYRLGR